MIIAAHLRPYWQRKSLRRTLGLLIWVLALLGCGGGGSSDSAPAQPPPPPPPPPAAPFGIDTRPNFGGTAIPVTDASGGPGTLSVERVFPNLSFGPLIFFSGVPGEARNVVVDLNGIVSVFADDNSTSSASTVIDLSSRVTSGGELGLLGLAFDPDFETNRAFYVHYTAASPLRSVISRFIWDATTDRAALSSEHIILTVNQPFSNHNAGMLEFGPDRRLYIALGDGGSGGDPQNNGQNMSVLLGKMLRIAPPTPPATNTYTIPSDNPFASSGSVRPEIWASGLRNPFRFSFDRESGTLWLGDVGQGQQEEIDIIRRGANYGWRIFEGTALHNSTDPQTPPYEAPIHTYGRSLGVAVIGGYVYRGSRLPSLYGHYLYGDNGSGRLWSLVYDGTSVASNTQIGTLSRIASFGEDNSAEVRMVSLSGTIHGFASSASGTAPPARLSQTGLFSNLNTLAPVSGVIEYDINQPFWSDGTLKRRWLAVPNGQQISFDASASWNFPVGSLLIKHFEIETQEGVAASRRRLETRVLARRPSGWYGLVYRWRTDGTDADLIADRELEPLTVSTASGNVSFDYEYPSRGDCLRCHNSTAGDLLGLRAPQLNRDFSYSAATDNQLRTLNHINLFTTDIGAASQYGVTPAINTPSASLTQRARAYLDVNCAMCHRPNGGTPVDLDLRGATDLAATGALNVAPTAGDLGIGDAAIIASGAKERSVLWQRMRRTDGQRMPPVASHRVDDAAVTLVGDWIDSL